MKHLVAIVGTNSKLSTNRQLLEYMKEHFKQQAEIELIEIKGIPIFKKSAGMQVPEETRKIAAKIEQSDGVIIGTPEYDHAVPAALLSLLAWLSYGQHPLVDKPVMITGASFGTLGSSRAQAQLRQVLDSPEIKARIMTSSEFLLDHSLEAFQDKEHLVNKELADQLDGLFEDFIEFIDISSQLGNAHAANKQQAKDFSWESSDKRER